MKRLFLAATVAALAVTAVFALWVTPPRVDQGYDAVRLLYLHAPTAWIAYLAFGVTALGSALWLWPRTRSIVWDRVAGASAEIGVIFTALTLVLGSLWGRPTWGTYWAWDARMTSELILLFLYFGYMALRHAIDDARRADRASAVLALVGVVNVPIIYFSVKWWNTLHQGASVSLTRAPSMAATMLVGMLIMALAAWMYAIAASLYRVRSIILEREAHADWVRQMPEASV